MLADYVKTTYIFVQLSATHNGSQHRGGCWLPSPIIISMLRPLRARRCMRGPMGRGCGLDGDDDRI